MIVYCCYRYDDRQRGGYNDDRRGGGGYGRDREDGYGDDRRGGYGRDRGYGDRDGDGKAHFIGFLSLRNINMGFKFILRMKKTRVSIIFSKIK